MIKKILFSGSVPYLIVDLINKSIPFLLLPFLTHYLSPASFGIVSNFSVAIVIFQIIIGLSVNGSIMANYYHYDEEKFREFSSSAIFLITLLTAALVALILGVSMFANFEKWGYSTYILVMAAICSYWTIVFSTCVSLYRVKRKLTHFIVLQLLTTIANYGLTLYFLIAMKMDYNGRILGIALSTILSGILSISFMVKAGIITTSINKVHFIEARKFGLPLIPHQLSKWVRNGYDKLILTFLFGLTVNGIYSFYLQIATVLYLLVESINVAYQPSFFNRLKNTPMNYKTHVKNNLLLLGALLAIAVVMFLGFYFVGPLLFNAKYFQSTIVLLFILFAMAFRGVNLFTTNAFFFYKETKSLAKTSIIASVIHLIFSFAMAKFFGIYGTCVALLVVEVFICFNNIYMLKDLKQIENVA
ncbi:MAG: hypothetical protein EOP51_06500 [Sphingobacteriales bacterium]|nr:MAG: hypothetical protein EOP51_06500 [Sphingobacteriales bacterium]